VFRGSIAELRTIPAAGDELAMRAVRRREHHGDGLHSELPDAGIRVGYDRGENSEHRIQQYRHTTTHSGITVNVRAGGVIENLPVRQILSSKPLHTGYWWGKGEAIHISRYPTRHGVPGVDPESAVL